MILSDYMVEAQIKCNDKNYAIYKVANWENEYRINIIGTSNEIPVTEPTKTHILKNMEQIRLAEFEIGDTKLNGMLGLAMQLNPNLADEKLEDLIDLEQKEFEMITSELENLEYKSAKDRINIDTTNYLIYKLEFDGHNLTSKPVNDFTKMYHMEEIKKLKNLGSN